MTDRKFSAMPDKLHGVVTEQLKAFDSGKEVFVTLSNDKTVIRTKIQNSLAHVYYSTIAEHVGTVSEDIEARCKRKFGISIMKTQAEGDSKKANEVYLNLVTFGILATDSPPEQRMRMINFSELSEEGQIQAMKILPCTRNFGIKLMKEYIEKIEVWAAKELGVVLESINERLKREGL